jgi:integrase
MLFIFASAGSIVETAYQFSQSDDKNGTNAVSCVPLHTPGSDSRTRLASKLPVVLSADEVVRFLEAIPSLKSRTALTTVYAAGLRVSEVVSLEDRRQRQPADGDPGRAGQGRQGPLRHALSAAPEDFTHLLAARSAEAMAVSRP